MPTTEDHLLRPVQKVWAVLHALAWLCWLKKGQIAFAADMIANYIYGSALEAPTVQQHIRGHIKVASGFRSDVCAWHIWLRCQVGCVGQTLHA